MNNQNNDNLILTFEGDNSVDVNLLVKTLEGISTSYKNTIQTIDYDIDVKLQVNALNKGSFEVVMSSIIDNIPPLFVGIGNAVPSIKTFMEIIKIKKELKGQKPKGVENVDGKSKIINHCGEEHFHDSNITNIYINNSIIDKSLAETFLPLTADTKEAINISSESEKIHINKEQFTEMATTIIDKTLNVENTTQVENIVQTELLLRKPDLMGESKWGFKYDKVNIDATIEDENFLSKVKNGTIKELYHGVSIPVKMKIIAVLDENLNPINKKYFVTAVTGDIIEPKEYQQQSLF